MKCVRTVSYNFMHEGDKFGDIIPQRGIRQEDLISPYLYILCAEGLSLIIRRYEEVGLIHGCSIDRGALLISHLLFVNDCYFFLKAKGTKAITLKNIHMGYEKLSGQAINLRKLSTVVFSPNTNDAERAQVCDTLQVNEVSTPGNYLGLPMFIRKKKNSAFGFSERVINKLHGWGNKKISRRGKLVLLKTTAQTIPNFWMNLFQIPGEVYTSIQRSI